MSPKSLTRPTLFNLLFLAAIFISLSASTVQAASEPVYIKVKSTRLRSAAQHYATSLDTLVLGDSVQLVNRYEGWYEVRTSRGKVGYLHESSISERKIVLTNTGARNSGVADTSDVVLAGKGFNQEVEKQFASQNPTLSFRSVDEMERIRVNEGDLLAFVKAGGLKSNG